MSDIVIKAEGISKSYLIGHQSNERYVALRDVIANKAKRLVSKIRGSQSRARKDIEEFWALKDVSFEVKQGERIGIIGRNGAGKSTLLKILSRITEPTTGRVSIKGRVASLLEVGTGFHPELTGRENIFLNGAILGMTRQEIKRKFDEIVAFAEVDKFLDTPVKHFSSGMYVRLAFAVAAHLEPEILVVDEVLAVGDASFQKKCLGKMSEVAQEGRTVLFVSHNMAAIKALCTSALVLNKGISSEMMDTDNAVRKYSENSSNTDETIFPVVKDELIVKDFYFTQNEQITCNFGGDYATEVHIEFEILKNLDNFRIGFFVQTPAGENICLCLLADWDEQYVFMQKGAYHIKATIPAGLLFHGSYAITLHSSLFGIKDYGLSTKVYKNITVTNPSNFRKTYLSERHAFGNVILNPNWEILHAEN